MSKKLLLADDSITIQKVIQITFAHEDYELTVTDNGDSALAKALEIKPDLVMADVYMPGKNGYELTSAIKQNPALQQVPVLLLAGSFEPFDEDKARSCKADAWIEKPFESQTLIDKVAELLSAAPPEASETPVPQASVPEALAPVAEPVAPLADAEPPAAVEEMSPATFEEPQETFLEPQAFTEPMSSEPEMAAAPVDPFSDISFEEEAPVVEPEPVVTADDWSDVVVEPPVLEPTVEDTFDAEDAFAIVEEPITESAEPAVDDSVAIEDAPVAETDFDVFEMGDDEIMPLGDDDILGEEDLEPIMPEQTLAAWSRDETGDEDIFAEPAEETTAFPEETSVFAEEPPAVVEEAPAFVEEAPAFVEETPAFVEETPAFVEETPALAEESPAFAAADPVVEEPPVFETPVAESVSVEEPPAVIEELEPAVVAAAMVDVEAKASALSEEEVEQIIEKVVTKVVEKFAESILERVAWEVVPDLAENLIREEIRKIKDAAA